MQSVSATSATAQSRSSSQFSSAIVLATFAVLAACGGSGKASGSPPAQAGASGSAGTAGAVGSSLGGANGAQTGGVGGASGASQSDAGSAGTSAGGTTAGGSGNANGTAGSNGSAGSAGATTVDFCKSLPHFTGTQTIDGAADDFAGIAPMVAKVHDLPWLNPTFSANLDSVVTVRVAWSDAALHAHVHVSDAMIYRDSWEYGTQGDNVQFFIAGTATLTGLYTGTEDHSAVHLVIAAPGPAVGSAAGNGLYFFSTTSGAKTASLEPATYTTRFASDGYDIELQFPWPADAEPRVSGGHVGFDFLVGATDTNQLELEAALANNPVPGAVPPQCGPIMSPGCDDRTWCLPQLAP